MKLYVAMVGLPARGKSTLAKRIRSGLEQQGIRTAIFNNGELRRMLFGLESGSAEFFNPDNTRAQRLRDQITHQNMERARAWLDEGGDGHHRRDQRDGASACGSERDAPGSARLVHRMRE